MHGYPANRVEEEEKKRSRSAHGMRHSIYRCSTDSHQTRDAHSEIVFKAAPCHRTSRRRPKATGLLNVKLAWFTSCVVGVVESEISTALHSIRMA